MNKEYLLLHISALILGSQAIVPATVNLPADVIIWWRCVFAIITFAIILWWKNKIDIQIIMKNFGKFMVTGVLLGLHWWLVFVAIQKAGVALGILSVFTYPLFTSLLEAFFFKQKFSWNQIISGIGIIGGVYFIVPEFTLENSVTLGVISGIISALLFAFRNIVSKKYLNQIPTKLSMMMQIIFALCSVSIPVFLFSSHQLFAFNGFEFTLLLLLGSFFTVFGHGLILYSLKNFSATTVGIIGSLQVVYAPLFTFLILGHAPPSSFYIGGLIILGIVIWEQYTF